MINRVILLFALIVLPTYCFSSGEDTIVFKSSYKNEKNRVVYKILKDGDILYTIGRYIQMFDLSNMDFNLRKEILNREMGRDGYLIGDNLYVVDRGNGSGSKYKKTPTVMLDFEEGISNFEENKGAFDSYSHQGNSFIDETGNPCPNVGLYSAKLSSCNNNEASLEKTINKTPEAFVTFWVNFDKLNHSRTVIPLLGNDSHEMVSLIAYSQNNQVFLGINVRGENEWIIGSDINTCEWYNLKIHFNDNEVELSYRSKECGNWHSLIREIHGLENMNISKLCLGIISEEESLVYIDDYYYHPTEIDEVSYINGAFSIYDKNTLEMKSRMNLDLRPNSVTVHGDYLYMCCLRGINVYDISNNDHPILVGTYRDKNPEFQGSDVFEKDGKTYLIVSRYSRGTSIYDITIPYQMRLVKNVPVKNQLTSTGLTFDVVCQYPYAYSTFTCAASKIFTDKDHRGILCLDLSDLNNITQTLYAIPEDAKSDVTTSDNQPNKITKYGDKLILNNSTKGMLIFDIGESGLPEYSYYQTVPGRSAVNAVSAFADGSLFAGDTTSGNAEYPDYGIYWYQFVAEVTDINTISCENKTVDNGWFTLNGQRMKGKPSQKGVYIHRGVKVVIP